MIELLSPSVWCGKIDVTIILCLVVDHVAERGDQQRPEGAVKCALLSTTLQSCFGRAERVGNSPVRVDCKCCSGLPVWTMSERKQSCRVRWSGRNY